METTQSQITEEFPTESRKLSESVIVWIQRGIIILACFLVVINLLSIVGRRNYSDVAEEVLSCLYTYTSDENTAMQLESLKVLVTPEVFDQLTCTSEYSNFTYIVWKKEFTSVRVVKSTESYVIYALQSPSFSESRRFVLFYETDKAGKLCEVRECEINDLVNFDENLY